MTERNAFRDEHGREQRIAAYGICTRMAPETGEPQVLLVRLNDRTSTPGAWMLPGGGVEFAEHPIDGVVREVEEETGYNVTVVELLTVESLERVIYRADEPDPVPYHAIRVIYRVAIHSGNLRHETDNSTDEAAWCSAADLDTMRLTELVIQARALIHI